MTFYARRRGSMVKFEGISFPKIQFGSGGFSIEVGSSLGNQEPGKAATFSWSSNPIPIKTLQLREEPVAAAATQAQNGADWDALCRKVVAEHANLSAFERDLYRRALKASVEERRRPRDSRRDNSEIPNQ